ncbi:MAG: isoprenylcysteine carboxylmethyltransferase family protein [Desulfobacteraceae bacterium]
MDRNSNPASRTGRGIQALAWLIPAFALLEPVWMLTPFVGFLYGSVLNIHTLESTRATSWLLLFVLPAGGFILPGLFVAVAGLGLFGVGAWQVYAAKVFRRGAVTAGVYRLLRHPQYTGLILAGAGLVMMWGRFIAYVSVFVMIYLYLMLSKKEEESCMARYGAAYEAYRKETRGVFPGADALSRVLSSARSSFGSRGPAAALGLLLTLALAVGSGFAILKAREAFCANTPLFQETVTWQDRRLALVSPRFPYLDPSKRKGLMKFWMKDVSPELFFTALESSEKIRDPLMGFQEHGMDAALMIFEPRLSVRERGGVTLFSFYLVPMEVKNGPAGMGLKDLGKNARPLGMLRIEDMEAVSGREPVHGNVRVVTATDIRRDETQKARIENKVAVLLSRFY